MNRAYWLKRQVNPRVLFRTTPTHLVESVITWCYRKLFYKTPLIKKNNLKIKSKTMFKLGKLCSNLENSAIQN